MDLGSGWWNCRSAHSLEPKATIKYRNDPLSIVHYKINWDLGLKSLIDKIFLAVVWVGHLLIQCDHGNLWPLRHSIRGWNSFWKKIQFWQYDYFWQFWQFLSILTIRKNNWKKLPIFTIFLDRLDIFDNFWQLGQFLTICFPQFLTILKISTICNNFDNFWQFFDNFDIFRQYWQLSTVFTIFDNFNTFWHFGPKWQRQS